MSNQNAWQTKMKPCFASSTNGLVFRANLQSNVQLGRVALIVCVLSSSSSFCWGGPQKKSTPSTGISLKLEERVNES